MFDQGRGPVVVVIPGLHGRWEWMRPALRELARACRVISFSLRGDIGSAHVADSNLGFEGYAQQLDEVLDRAGVERATVCGVSFGGFVALRYAIDASGACRGAGAGFGPRAGLATEPAAGALARRPWLSTPAFVATSPFRLWPEVCATHPGLTARLRFFARQGLRAAAAPMMPSLMARRIREAQRARFSRGLRSRRSSHARRQRRRTGSIVVVPVTNTRTYATLIRNARLRSAGRDRAHRRAHAAGTVRRL